MLTVCRLCLAKEPNFVIFNSQAAVRIVTCTGLEVDPKDKLPQLICNACRLRLEEFYHFRKRCHAADRRLRHLKFLESNPNGQVTNLITDTDDAAILQDVAQCSGSACSESNAQWRREAAELLRTEVDTYKKNLVGLCRQQVREEIEQEVRDEIEQEVRKEMGDLILAQTKKECRLNMLDDLFYEIETLFVHKRNSAVCEMSVGKDDFISDVGTSEMDNSSTSAGLNGNNCEVDLTETADFVDLSTREMCVEVIDDELPQQIPPAAVVSSNNKPSDTDRTAVPSAVVPFAMVEINMQNSQHSHLREDLKSTHFLLPKAAESPTKQDPKRSKPEPRPSPTAITPSKVTVRSQVCQKLGSPRQRSSHKATPKNFYRCRLRGSQDSK